MRVLGEIESRDRTILMFETIELLETLEVLLVALLIRAELYYIGGKEGEMNF